MPETALTDRVTTPLLTLITQQALDEDYQHVADRKPAGADGRRRRHRTAAIVVVAFGLLLGTAAVQTSERAGVKSASRASLITQIDEGRTALDELQRQLVRLREQNVALQSDVEAITTEQLAAEARVQRMAVSTGFAAVTGPGVRVVVDDAESGEAVRDRDLRPLVDGLWNAGAEAISVNGNRLTARSAIRNSGSAIRITGNNRNLSPPYTVLAIGDTKTLQAELMQTTSGLQFRAIAETFGFPWTMDNVDDLYLPAAPQRLTRLRSAQEGTAAQNRAENQKSMKEVPQ
ncbi:DUF881 domain-containing protein [Nocardioides hungaricus]